MHFRQAGGMRVGGFAVPWPLASVLVKRGGVLLQAPFREALVIGPSELRAITPIEGGLFDRVAIEHNVSGVDSPVLFSTRDSAALIAAAHKAGLLKNESA